MSDAWQSINVREFEYVVTGQWTALLRVSGKARRRRSGERRPVLVIDDGKQKLRFEPLPAPTDRGAVLHAAYAVPSSLVAPGQSFWLEHAGGARIELPFPEEGVARVMAREEPIQEPRAEPIQEPRAEPIQEPGPGSRPPEPALSEPPLSEPPPSEPPPPEPPTAAELAVSRGREQIAALERRISELDGARERDVSAAREQAAEAQSRAVVAEQHAAESEARSADIEAQALAATTEAQSRAGAAEQQAAEAQARAAAAEQRTADAQARAAEAEAHAQAASADAQARAAAAEERAQAATERAATATTRADSLEHLRDELEEAVRAKDAEIAALEREVADAAPARKALEREVERLHADRDHLESELQSSRDQLRMMTLDRDELARQAAAFDAVATKARERAAHAEAANDKTTSTLRELEIWRGELERRLAETTSELGAAKAALETDARELARLRSGEAHRAGDTSKRSA